MVAAIKAGLNCASSLVPRTDMEEKIYSIYLVSLLLVMCEQKERSFVTRAHLSIPDGTPFIYWFNHVSKLTPPTPAHVRAHLPDLIRKMISATAFYFTAHLSFHTIVKNLCPPSEKVSKLVLPILEKTFNGSLLHSLPSARLVAFAPAIAKLLQMTLIHLDPKQEVFKTPKTIFYRI